MYSCAKRIKEPCIEAAHLAGGGAADDERVAAGDVRGVVHRQFRVGGAHYRRCQRAGAVAVGAERRLAQRVEKPVAEPVRRQTPQY